MNNNEVENHGGSTETPTNEEPKKGWRKILERAVNWLSHKDNKNNWLNEMKGNLSLIATVIATMTFQMALNPPGGVIPIKDDANPPGANANPPDANANPPGGDINPEIYYRFPMWLLSIGMCITLTSLALSYITAVQMTTSDHVFEKANKFLRNLVFAWMGLLAIVALYHTLRLVLWGINFFLKKMAKTQKFTKATPVC